MKNSLFIFVLINVLFLSSCIKNSDWGEVIIPASQKLVFSSSDNDLYKNEKNIFIKVDEKNIFIKVDEKNEMYITNKNLVSRICYLKLAFPNKDILIQYIKIEEGGEVKLDPRFINLQK